MKKPSCQKGFIFDGFPTTVARPRSLMRCFKHKELIHGIDDVTGEPLMQVIYRLLHIYLPLLIMAYNVKLLKLRSDIRTGILSTTAYYNLFLNINYILGFKLQQMLVMKVDLLLIVKKTRRVLSCLKQPLATPDSSLVIIIL
ncbi:unnamed protein product [Lactuca virosa]|uniref:Adenylate kinase n=1 Tax=Lactuca virosa TaxID=75947 RepID=A0AAU9LIH2_9ASTR|nr:unnamed protein product [Lactuca virosa]